MRLIEILHNSILRDLGLQDWGEIADLPALLSTGAATITPDEHLLLRQCDAIAEIRREAIDDIGAAASLMTPSMLLSGGFVFRAFHAGTEHLGGLLHLEPLHAPGNYEHPDVFGNVMDQPPGCSVLTVVFGKRTLAQLVEQWRTRFGFDDEGNQSALYSAANGAAIQARFSWNSTTLEDMVDAVISGSFAVQGKRNSRMLHGLSYTQIVTKPKYAEQVIRIEDEYGPFERM